jgi:hypothetical protein
MRLTAYAEARIFLFMPEVGLVGSLKIVIFNRDHLPVHVHVRSQDGKKNLARIEVRTGRVIDGSLSRPDLKRVRAWLRENEAMLIAAWNRCEGQKEER